LWHAGSPGEEIVAKRRRTASRGRDFVVKIEFAAKIRMKAIEDMMRGAMGKGDLEQEERALDALRVLDIVLRESASERYVPLRSRLLFHSKSRCSSLRMYAQGAVCNALPYPLVVLLFGRGYLLVRDNFFHKDLGPVGNLGEGVEAWRGYHSSVRPTGLGLTLNLGELAAFQHFCPG
jgi:eukaryotic translation initiation factor 2C